MSPDDKYCPSCASPMEEKEAAGRQRPVCPNCGRVVFYDPKVAAICIVERGETPEQGALRELEEETGLQPSGPVRLAGVTAMPLYGHEALRVMYAAPCEKGEVVLNDEHEGFRWIDARDYRDRYFSDEVIATLEASSERHGVITRAVRATLEEYLARD